MCWTWLGCGFRSTESLVADGRAGGSTVVPGLPAAGYGNRLSLMANTLWSKDEFWAMLYGQAKKGCVH